MSAVGSNLQDGNEFAAVMIVYTTYDGNKASYH